MKSLTKNKTMKRKYTLAAIFTPVLMAVLFSLPGCGKDQNQLTCTPHTCKWELCPYKGLKCGAEEWSRAVQEYTECEPGTDAHCIDMLHLEYPEDGYETLEEKLLTHKKTQWK